MSRAATGLLGSPRGGRVIANTAVHPAVLPTILAALFFFHPASMSFVGRAYYWLIGLNDVMAPVRINVLLQPATILSLAFIVWRGTHRAVTIPKPGSKYGLGPALGLLLAGATTGFLANLDQTLVAMTYWSGFFASALVYVALSRLMLDERDIDWMFLALAAGAAIPLAAGWYVYYSNWGFPEFSTVISAQGDRATFVLYEEVTFGNRVNTASLLVLIAPPLLCLAVDNTRPFLFRIIWFGVLGLVGLNLLILQQRAAFLVLAIAAVLIFRFRFGWRAGYALSAVIATTVLYGIQAYAPATAEMLYGRFAPVLTVDASADASVDARLDAMLEGLTLAEANMPFGIGPGAAVTKHSRGSGHQFNVDQAMEGGLFGLIGSIFVCVSLGIFFVHTNMLRNRTPFNRRRFLMTIGPAMYFLNGVLANGPTASGYINSWAILCVGMLALAPGITSDERSTHQHPRNNRGHVVPQRGTPRARVLASPPRRLLSNSE